MSIEFENKPLEWGVEGVEPSEEKKAQGFANSEAPAAGHWDYKFRSDFLVQKELQEKVSELSEQGIDTSKLVTEEEFMSHKADETAHGVNTKMPIEGGMFTGITKAFTNTSYTVAQMRNVIISTATPTSADGSNGDIWIKY